MKHQSNTPENMTSNRTNTSSFLERAFIFLEDGDWNRADEYCERVLDIEPKNATAYIGKLMAEFHVSKREDLIKIDSPLENNGNYLKAIRFGDDMIRQELEEVNQTIKSRAENERKTEKYNNAVQLFDSAKTEEEFIRLISTFRSLEGYKNADALVERCEKNAELVHKASIYNNGILEMKKNTIEGYEKAIEAFEQLGFWHDANVILEECQKKLFEARKKKLLDEEKKRGNKRIAIIMVITAIVGSVIAFFIPVEKMGQASIGVIAFFPICFLGVAIIGKSMKKDNPDPTVAAVIVNSPFILFLALIAATKDILSAVEGLVTKYIGRFILLPIVFSIVLLEYIIYRWDNQGE